MTNERSDSSSSFIGRWSKRKLRQRGATDAPEVHDASDADRIDNIGSTANTLQTSLEQPFLVEGIDNGAAVSNSDSAQVNDAFNHPDVHSQASAGAVDDPSVKAASVMAEEANPVDEVLLSDEDMPSIESLTANSDVSPFFNKGVSKALRQAALKHVFSLPVYNIRDGLNDYDEDFTTFEPLGDTITCDMKFHAERKEKERQERERLEQERLAQEQLEQEDQELLADEGAESREADGVNTEGEQELVAETEQDKTTEAPSELHAQEQQPEHNVEGRTLDRKVGQRVDQEAESLELAEVKDESLESV